MSKRMLIDASQKEENRVAIVEGNKLEAFEFESVTRKQIKGNIYLAKVTRVEPSLQAAFLEYGGNRQGFLAFSEVHPDYYRIPIEDRERLIKEEAELEEAYQKELEEELEREEKEKSKPKSGNKSDQKDDDDQDDDSDDSDGDVKEVAKDQTTETVSGGEEIDEDEVHDAIARRVSKLRRRYKIQEVMERRQIMLLQATKEERGTKGAAMTTYISLPGRYCVLMPNSPKGGGVSRKISNSKDRRRMKEILSELDVPPGMSVILRTAGVKRNKTEIKRDLDYLLRLWDEIREKTMESVAPELIYEEGNLCRRAVRDLYTREIDEVMVSGEEGYKEVKEFMKTQIPSHAKRVKLYDDTKLPLFHRYRIEKQISDIFSPRVDLPSGGYLIINQTEALVAIDVNSGRSTKARNIEKTALHTNLETAEEVARQLRLRDMGGLVVIDFIDMENRRNNKKVERALKKAMSTDRARIEIGRISAFGLLELSRQRLNPSVVEAHFKRCDACEGMGIVRTVDSAALVALRALEKEGITGNNGKVTISLPTEVALYVLNHKKSHLQDIEGRYGISVSVKADNSMSANETLVESEKGTTRSQPDHIREDNKDDDSNGDGGNKNQNHNKGNGNRSKNKSRSRSKSKSGGGKSQNKSSDNKKSDNKNETNSKSTSNNKKSSSKSTAKKSESDKKSDKQTEKDKAEEKKKDDTAANSNDTKGKSDSDTKTPAKKNSSSSKKKSSSSNKSKPKPKSESSSEKKSSPADKSDSEKSSKPSEPPRKGWWQKVAE